MVERHSHKVLDPGSSPGVTTMINILLNGQAIGAIKSLSYDELKKRGVASVVRLDVKKADMNDLLNPIVPFDIVVREAGINAIIRGVWFLPPPCTYRTDEFIVATNVLLEAGRIEHI